MVNQRNYLASCLRNKILWIWEYDNNDDSCIACNSVLQKHTQDVKMVKEYPREDVLFSCSFDNNIKIC